MIRWLISAGLAMLVSPLQAAETCRLALALAMDISTSVDPTEDALQRQGLAAALRAPEVQDAFFSSAMPVALSAYEWSGRFNQAVLLDWVLIDSPATLFAAAEQIGLSRRSDYSHPTAMGHALAFGAIHMERRRAACSRPSTSQATEATMTGTARRRRTGISPLIASWSTAW